MSNRKLYFANKFRYFNFYFNLDYAANISTQSDEQFIDVQTIVLIEKIEQYLTEADRLFEDESSFKPAMSYLISHFWSIIAYQYSDENLPKLKTLRDSLLTKIDSVDNKLTSLNNTRIKAVGVEKSCNTVSSMNSSINVIDVDSELETFKHEAEVIKSKMSEQTELIKSLLHQMNLNKLQEPENRSTLTQSTVDANLNSNSTSIDKESDDHDRSFSPSSSPTSGLFDYFKRKWDMRTSVKIDKRDESLTSSQIITEKAKSEKEANSNENSSANTSSDISTANDPNFYFYYNVNDYIAIDKNLALNEQLKELAKNNPEGLTSESSMVSSADSKISKLNESGPIAANENGVIIDSKKTPANGMVDQVNANQATNSKGSQLMYNQIADSSFTIQCPVCMVSVDSRVVPLDDYEKHVMSCSNEKNQLVCMFCLRVFNHNEQYVYEEHVDGHLNNS